MSEKNSTDLGRRDFVKSAALGVAAISAGATGIIGSSAKAYAAGNGGPAHRQNFSVITIGTGNPIPDKNRASACTMIQYNGHYYILDTGNGCNDVFAGLGYPYPNINAILYTHLHADHMTDFVDLMINRWMTGGKEMQIIGPPRSGAYYNFMVDFFADDLTYRQFRGYAAGISEVGMFSGIDITELTGKNTFELHGMKVSTAPLTHTMYNLGYRFDVDGKTIVVSGDTSYDPGLIELAKDADVLVIDANIMTSTEMKGAEETAFTDGSIQKPKPKFDYAGNFDVAPHMGIDEVARTAAAARVKKVVLTHLPPAPFNMEKVKPYFDRAGFKGQVIEGHDGLEIDP